MGSAVRQAWEQCPPRLPWGSDALQPSLHQERQCSRSFPFPCIHVNKLSARPRTLLHRTLGVLEMTPRRGAVLLTPVPHNNNVFSFAW